MTELEFVFDESPWRQTLDALRPGSSIGAVQLLTLLEHADEEEMLEALDLLDERKITLDISTLPAVSGEGETAVRLRWEQQLVQQENFVESLEQTDPLRLYLQELAAIPVAGDPALLAERYLQGEDELGKQLVDHRLSRVVELAKELTGRGVLLLDLIQEGSLGLWQGVLNYTGGDFAICADWWIRQYQARAVFAQARAGDIGQKLRQGMEDFRDVDQQLLSQLGRNPTLEEIARKMHVSVEDAAVYADMLNMARYRRQLTDTVEQTTQPEEEEQAVENTAYFQSRQRILEMLSTLTEKEAKLLTMRFGLEGGALMDPQQIGKVLGLTPEEAVQMEAAALAKLRQQG